MFTAGIGENDAAFRRAVCANLDQLGIILDDEKNLETKAREALISAPDSRVKIMTIPTNEELVVAREVKRYLDTHQAQLETRKTKAKPPAVQTHLSVLKSKLTTDK